MIGYYIQGNTCDFGIFGFRFGVFIGLVRLRWRFGDRDIQGDICIFILWRYICLVVLVIPDFVISRIR